MSFDEHAYRPRCADCGVLLVNADENAMGICASCADDRDREENDAPEDRVTPTYEEFEEFMPAMIDEEQVQ